MTSEPAAAEPRPWGKVAVAIFGLLFGLTVLLAVVSLPAGLYAVLFTTITPGYGAWTLVAPYLWVGPVPLILPFFLPLGLLFAVLVATYAGLLALSAFKGKSLPQAFSAGYREGFSTLMSNDLVVAIVSIGFLTFTAFVIDALVTAGGAQIGGITGNDLSVFFSTTIAPLVEEFGFRVCIIGLVALFLVNEKSSKSLLGALWRPASTYEGAEIRSGKMFALGAALAISSVIFGLLHIFSGSGWAIGKLPEAAYGGLVLGYVYIRYGFHVAVLTHWGIDYLGTAFSFFGQGAYGIPWSSVPGYAVQQVVSLDMVLGIGLVSFILVVYLGATSLLRSRRTALAEVAGSS